MSDLIEWRTDWQEAQEELDDCVELDVVTHTAGQIDAER